MNNINLMKKIVLDQKLEEKCYINSIKTMINNIDGDKWAKFVKYTHV